MILPLPISSGRNYPLRSAPISSSLPSSLSSVSFEAETLSSRIRGLITNTDNLIKNPSSLCLSRILVGDERCPSYERLKVEKGRLIEADVSESSLHGIPLSSHHDFLANHRASFRNNVRHSGWHPVSRIL